MNKAKAAKARNQIIKILKPFIKTPPATNDPDAQVDAYEIHADVRVILNDVLTTMGAYDAGGCPLCLG